MDLLSVPMNAKGNRKERELQKIKKRLEALADSPANRNCADCPEGDPTWASLLSTPVEGGKPLAVLCCAQCRPLHVELGAQVCQVKSIRAVSQCEWCRALGLEEVCVFSCWMRDSQSFLLLFVIKRVGSRGGSTGTLPRKPKSEQSV